MIDTGRATEVSLDAVADGLDEPWKPVDVTGVNGSIVRMARLERSGARPAPGPAPDIDAVRRLVDEGVPSSKIDERAIARHTSDERASRGGNEATAFSYNRACLMLASPTWR